MLRGIYLTKFYMQKDLRFDYVSCTFSLVMDGLYNNRRQKKQIPTVSFYIYDASHHVLAYRLRRKRLLFQKLCC